MDDTLDDGQLIEASWADPRRFEELFHRHYAAVFQLCARRVGRSESEDLAGETFCRAFASRRRFDVSRPHARPWLYGIALNLVRTHHRGRFRRGRAYERHAVFIDAELEFASLVEGEVDAHRELAKVVEAMLRLPADDVDILLLHVWEELSYKAIAEALAVPVATVRSRLYRIRRQLRDVIDRDEPPHSPFGFVAPLDTGRIS